MNVTPNADSGTRVANALKVAVCEYLLSVNAVDPVHPLIPPTSIDWLGNGIVSAVLDALSPNDGSERTT